MSPETADATSAALIACCQLEIRIGDLRYNRAATRRAIESAAGAGASIIVLPELASSGYVFHDIEEARAAAERPDGTTVTTWSRLARQYTVTIVGGFCEHGVDGNLYNSAVLVDEYGRRAVYRKAHLWDREKTIFTPGDDAPIVVQSAGHRIGVLICYDLDFAEWPRTAAMAGADLLCVPANWPDYGQVREEQSMELIRARAAASVNHVFVAACTRVGSERGVAWVGQSAILDPEGWVLATADLDDGERILLASCELGTAANKRVSDNNDLLRDRRPDLYASAALELVQSEVHGGPWSSTTSSNVLRNNGR